MGRRLLFPFVLLLLLMVIGGAVALLFVDIPAPTKRIERIVPNDRLAR